ncbi:hypothetical protein GXP67_12100 [Rhodocytophaga rosea]|uniref:Uncharacterized protein n=1 Tax=Rhodocytophaga rosea TaxID=2704465 RepID=A0A6C0GHZ9_9BACT|nr:hypothetical protein [Rhodocytophaga rosea]QHT67323.1 hypothetical protein GXP67_12100 [Rhodocytophaga rosea]
MVEGENILVAGLYVKGNLLKDSHCDGIFLSSYTPSGQVNFETFNSWQQEVKQGYIKGGIEASWINEQSTEKAILQSIKKTEKGYIVLAESFKKVFNGADIAALIGSGLVYSMVGVAPFINPQLTSYKVMDMLLYDFDTKGMLQQVKK